MELHGLHSISPWRLSLVRKVHCWRESKNQRHFSGLTDISTPNDNRGANMLRRLIATWGVALLAGTPAFADSNASGQATASATTVTAPIAAQGDLDEIIVNGIRRGDLILPTTVTS